jgi:hypothetical protein
MSDPRLSFGTAFARDAGGPIRSFITAACDAWSIGFSALQLMVDRAAATATDAGQAAAGDPLSTLIALSNGFTAVMGDFIAQGSGQRTGPHPGGPDAPPQAGVVGDANISSLMARALMVGVASTLRYWRSLAGVYSRHQEILVQAAARRTMAQSPISPAEDRLLVDNLQAFFREIGEVAMQEARRLEKELEQIGEALALGMEQPDASPGYRRRWKAKD